MTDKAFEGVGKEEGLLIWRIEKLEVVPVPKEEYGAFYSGDSYILLNTKKTKSGFEWDIHFWLGKDSSQDEQGIAAYKSVELDDSLGGTPVQHREIQEHESNLFLSYFKKMGGVRYLEGGVESGFRHVDPNAYEARLLHLKGKRNVKVKQVELTAGSMNHGDVFILDKGLTIFQWNGKTANRFEKAKGLELCTKIKNDERGGKAKLEVVEDGEDNKEFWELLGDPSQVKAESEVPSDQEAEKSAVAKLYRVSDASGTMELTEVPDVKQESLDTNDCFILDGESELFVWVGKGSTSEEKKKSMAYASEFLQQNNRPSWTPVTRIIETGETPLFKSKFPTWKEPYAVVVDFSKLPKGNIAASKKQEAIDVAKLHSRGPAVEEETVDNGTGEVTIWRIENMDKVELPKEDYGTFYSGDSYIILYKYQKNRRDEYIIYFWQGRNSSQDEKGASAILSMKLDEELNGAATQVRVVQGKEPNHFLAIFKGKFISLKGGVPTGFKNRKEQPSDQYDPNGVALFHVKGTNANNTRASQVDAIAPSLNSGDSFVLHTADKVFIWYGRGANEEERSFAVAVADRLKGERPTVEVEEEEEPEEFWEALGGKAEYPTSVVLLEGVREPRLFHCSNANGVFEVEEVFNFSQEDLIDEDVMMLDAYTEVFVWIGSQSNQQEKEMAMKLAVDYVEKAQDGRSPDIPVMRVDAGREPPMFTCHFLGWDSDKAAKFVDPYEKKLRALQLEKEAKQQELDRKDSAHAISSPTSSSSSFNPTGEGVIEKTFVEKDINSLSYEDLKVAPGKPIPQGIDVTKREWYLSEAEFKEVFGITKEQFYKLPGWKQQQKKKDKKLF